MTIHIKKLCLEPVLPKEISMAKKEKKKATARASRSVAASRTLEKRTARKTRKARKARVSTGRGGSR